MEPQQKQSLVITTHASYASRMDSEGSRAFAAFCIYRDLGTERSLEKVSQTCQKSVSLLRRWSAKFMWVKRAEAFDNHIQEVEQSKRDVEIEKILDESRYAQVHNRIAALDTLLAGLESQLYRKDAQGKVSGIDENNLYLPNGKGGLAFNTGLVAEYRNALGDLAAETGGRVKPRAEQQSSANGPVIGIKVVVGVDWENDI